jgi:serine/threonine-protein kinase HipA
MIRAVDIFLHEKRIGQITLLPGDNTFFSFDQSYIDDVSRPTLSQSFMSNTGELITKTRTTHTRLQPFFSNLLPEGHLREYLAALNQINPQREFDLLESLGADLPGAVMVRPVEEDLYPGFKEETWHYRFSLAGVQLKFSAIAARQGGLTIPAHGIGGTWVVKLPSMNFMQIPENEFAIMSLAQKVGIDVPECRLINMNDIAGLPDVGPLQGQLALAVKRFDRGPDNTRIHMEDFAQVYNVYPEQKYEKVSYTNIANMVWTLCGEEGLTEFIRRLVFSILVGNGDMHLKNWSFLYPDGHTPVLSPAYDLLSTIPYLPADQLALTLVKTKQMHLCDEQLFLDFAAKAKLPKHLVQSVTKQTVIATREHWQSSQKDLNLDPRIVSKIDQHMNSIPL